MATKTRSKRKAKGKALAVVKKAPVQVRVQGKPDTDGMLTLAEYKRKHEMLTKFVKGYLKKGDNATGDFGYIVKKDGSKVSNQPVLFKRGAEKLAELYQLGTRLKCVKDEENWGKEKVGDLFMSYTYRCDIFKLDNPDVVIAQCEGAANSREKACRDYDGPQPANSIRKRAQKRAYVGAVLMATRSSQWFTQDMEDGNPDEPNVQQSAKPEGRKKKESRLHILAGEIGETKPATEAYLKKTYGDKSATKLKPEELDGEVNRLSRARDIVAIAKAQGHRPDAIKATLEKKYGFTSWLDVKMDKIEEILKKARAAMGGA